MTSNYSNVNVKIEKKQSKHNNNIEFNTLRNYAKYITLTDYYIVKDTFRSQVMTTM